MEVMLVYWDAAAARHGAEQLMAAKITEFAVHLMSGDRSAAERARPRLLQR